MCHTVPRSTRSYWCRSQLPMPRISCHGRPGHNNSASSPQTNGRFTQPLQVPLNRVDCLDVFPEGFEIHTRDMAFNTLDRLQDVAQGKAEPIEVLRAVRPIIVEGDIRNDAEELGSGAQSALAVAIAKAYADIVRQPMILAVEEPELYLHPHGCRHFYKLLRHLSEADNLQVIYTTHERSFVNAGDFADIHIVRKPHPRPRSRRETILLRKGTIGSGCAFRADSTRS